VIAVIVAAVSGLLVVGAVCDAVASWREAIYVWLVSFLCVLLLLWAFAR